MNTENITEDYSEEQTKPFIPNDTPETEPEENKAYVPYVHNFKKPFEYEGKVYESIVFDFERLTGRDMLSIESEMAAKNEYAISPEISRSYLCGMSARAGKIGSDVLVAMPIKDFNKITGAARNFLLGTGY